MKGLFFKFSHGILVSRTLSVLSVFISIHGFFLGGGGGVMAWEGDIFLVVLVIGLGGYLHAHMIKSH